MLKESKTVATDRDCHLVDIVQITLTVYVYYIEEKYSKSVGVTQQSQQA